MTSLIILSGVVISLAFLFYWFMKPAKAKPVNFTDPAQLRFVKGEYWDSYYVQFFNPAYDQWWTLPELEAGIHAPWSFQSRGSYGAYDLNMLKVSSSEIEDIKRKYTTLADIEDYMVRLRKKYNDFQESERKDRNRPQVIY
jgi:hypothetical protein